MTAKAVLEDQGSSRMVLGTVSPTLQLGSIRRGEFRAEAVFSIGVRWSFTVTDELPEQET